MVADQVSNLRGGFLLEGQFLNGSLDCTLRNHLVGEGAGDLEDVRSMKAGCLSGRRRKIWWEQNIVMFLKSLLKSLVGGARCSNESRCL